MPLRPTEPRALDLVAQVKNLPRAEIPAILAAVAARLVEPEERESPRIPLPPQPSRGAEGDRLLTSEQVALRLGLDLAAVSRRRFPFRVKLGRRTVRYSEQGLARWMRREGSS